MIKVYVNKQSNYPVSATKLKGRLIKFLTGKGIVSDALVNISLVGDAKMKALGRKHLNDSELHNVLSFPESEIKGDFKYPDDQVIHLGEIVVCYPKAVEEAKDEEKLIEEKVYELIEHGARHLLGENHE